MARKICVFRLGGVPDNAAGDEMWVPRQQRRVAQIASSAAREDKKTKKKKKKKKNKKKKTKKKKNTSNFVSANPSPQHRIEQADRFVYFYK
jgi:hypothetical protein